MDRPSEVLTGERVKLVRWSTTDAASSFELVTSASAHLRTFMPWVDGFDAAQNLAYLKSCEADWAAGTSFQYSIHHRQDPVGSCGLTHRAGTAIMEIGYWLHPDHTGQGLVTEAVRSLIQAAFRLPHITRVEIIHDAQNRASEGVPRRLQFNHIGTRDSLPPLPPGDSGVEVIWSLSRDSSDVGTPQ